MERRSVRPRLLVTFVLLCFIGLLGCGREESAGDLPVAEVAATRCEFVDISGSSGIDFVHFNDASDDRLLPETMGSGAAFFDFDGDGLPDVYLVNGASLGSADRDGDSETGAGRRFGGALYRNLGGGSFEDVTSSAGVGGPFFGMGAAVGDVDNDGWIDLVVTALGEDRLYRNRGDGTFEDASAAYGLTDTGFTTSAAFLDFDRDGFLDLFLCRYVEWSIESDLECRPDGVHRIYCTPEAYPGTSNLLLRNVGGTRFEDVSEESGIAAVPGKALGVVPLDHDGDGWPDLAIANDTVRNLLFRNRGDGTFEEIGTDAGIAFSESGAPRGGMGIDAGDLDGDGRADIIVTNFAHEMVGLFVATGRGSYLDDAPHLGLGFPTLLTLGFGVLLEDLDADGHLDVVVANGHIEPNIGRIQRGQSYAQPPQIFFGEEGGRLVLHEGVGVIETPLVARGLAAADIDLDGDLDLLFTQNGQRARLYRNDSPGRDWIRVVLEGAGPDSLEDPEVHRSSRSGYGARIELHANGVVQTRDYVSARSYLSAQEPGVTFGSSGNGALVVDSLVVRWPSGSRQALLRPAIRRRHLVRESP